MTEILSRAKALRIIALFYKDMSIKDLNQRERNICATLVSSGYLVFDCSNSNEYPTMKLV